MSIYHLGMDVQRNWCPQDRRWYNDPVSSGVALQKQSLYQSGVHVGAPWVATPGTIKDEVNTINTEVRSMDDELGAQRRTWPAELSDDQKVMDEWFSSVWLPFFVEWNKFFADHGEDGVITWWNNIWGAAWDQAQDYRKRLAEMRKSAESVGYGFRAPIPQDPKKHPLAEPLADLWDTIKTVIWVGVFIFGAVILFRYLPIGGH